MFKKFELLFLVFLLMLVFVLRLYRFDNPIADWHSWRQADTSSVSRHFVENGVDVLHPKYMDLSNIASGMNNPEGYRFVEFPVYNLLQIGVFKISSFPLEQSGRLVSILASVVSTLLIFLIVKRRLGFFPAFMSASFFAFLPFSVYFGRTILPDQTMVAASLAGIYFFDQLLKEVKVKSSNLKVKSGVFFVFSLFFTASAFLLKPYALFFTLPMIVIAYQAYGFSMFKKLYLWLFLILAITPLISWRLWIAQFPQGIPASDWLFNGGDIRFKGSFFYWIFGERIAKLILGYWGVSLLVLGLIAKIEKRNLLFFGSFLASSILYLFTMARGNVQHDYYQILIIPSIAIFLGIGVDYLVTSFPKIRSYPLAVVVVVFMFLFSWYFVRDFFNINNWSIVRAGEEVDRLIPKDAKVVANYNGDTSFLYQTKRSGWPSFQASLSEMKQIGADYLILVNPTEKDFEIGKEYVIVKSTTDFILFNLNKKP